MLFSFTARFDDRADTGKSLRVFAAVSNVRHKSLPAFEAALGA
jgi:hypothetical protein